MVHARIVRLALQLLREIAYEFKPMPTVGPTTTSPSTSVEVRMPVPRIVQRVDTPRMSGRRCCRLYKLKFALYPPRRSMPAARSMDSV
jgi:hypothetical protein